MCTETHTRYGMVTQKSLTPIPIMYVWNESDNPFVGHLFRHFIVPAIAHFFSIISAQIGPSSRWLHPESSIAYQKLSPIRSSKKTAYSSSSSPPPRFLLLYRLSLVPWYPANHIPYPVHSSPINDVIIWHPRHGMRLGTVPRYQHLSCEVRSNTVYRALHQSIGQQSCAG